MRLGQKILGHVKTLGKKVGKVVVMGGALLLGAKAISNEYDKSKGYEGASQESAKHIGQFAKKRVIKTGKALVITAPARKGGSRAAADGIAMMDAAKDVRSLGKKLEASHKQGRASKSEESNLQFPTRRVDGFDHVSIGKSKKQAKKQVQDPEYQEALRQALKAKTMQVKPEGGLTRRAKAKEYVKKKRKKKKN